MRRPAQSAAALSPERGARSLGRKCAQPGAPEVAVIAGCFDRLAHVSPCSSGRAPRTSVIIERLTYGSKDANLEVRALCAAFEKGPLRPRPGVSPAMLPGRATPV